MTIDWLDVKLGARGRTDRAQSGFELARVLITRRREITGCYLLCSREMKEAAN